MMSACVTVLSLCLLLIGCSPHILHPDALAKDATMFQPLPDGSETLIGVALSGGGSRAAYFGAGRLGGVPFDSSFPFGSGTGRWIISRTASNSSCMIPSHRRAHGAV